VDEADGMMQEVDSKDRVINAYRNERFVTYKEVVE